jgi:NADPH-dependent 2,4-dienoyl-CoA reductase/sulfur reductase-like enzyme
VHEKKGTTFRLGSSVERFEGSKDGVKQVVLSGGDKLDADMVVVGIGVRPATDFLKGIETNEDGSITVDGKLRAGEDLFAAGDVVRFPDWRDNKPIRIEHWRLAQQLGRTAALNMMDRNEPYRGVPFFWTNQFMLITQYVGCARGWDEIVFEGDPEDHNFMAFYVKDNKVHAVAGCKQDRKMDVVGEMFRQDRYLALDEIRNKLK